MLSEAILNHDNSKKFLIDGFPIEVSQAEMFEEKVSHTRSGAIPSSFFFRKNFNLPVGNTCSKLAIETLEQGVKYVQS